MLALASVAIGALVVFGYLRRDPTSGVDRATVGPAIDLAVTTPATPPAAGTAVPLSADNTELMFTGSSALGAQPGFFSELTGEATVDSDGKLIALRGEVVMSSVLTNADSLTAKLKAEPGLFEIGKFPTAAFASTRIVPLANDPKATHTIEGELTLRGIARPISFPAKVTHDGERVVVSSVFSVNRHDFGITYDGGTAFPEIRPDVLINMDIRAALPERDANSATSVPA